MTCALHKNLIDNSSIKYALTGRFLDSSSFFIQDKEQDQTNTCNSSTIHLNINGKLKV